MHWNQFWYRPSIYTKTMLTVHFIWNTYFHHVFWYDGLTNAQFAIEIFDLYCYGNLFSKSKCSKITALSVCNFRYFHCFVIIWKNTSICFILTHRWCKLLQHGIFTDNVDIDLHRDPSQGQIVLKVECNILMVLSVHIIDNVMINRSSFLGMSLKRMNLTFVVDLMDLFNIMVPCCKTIPAVQHQIS